MNALIEPDIRPGHLAFEDRINFRWGIARSGVFSISQSQFLQKYGETLKCLELGILEPATPTEEHFVSFCLGLHEAGNELETLWRKYKANVKHDTVAS